MHKRIQAIIFSCLGIDCLYLGMDLLNLPAKAGIHVSQINWNAAAIILGNSVVIGLYLVTFHLIDRRNLQKDKNQRNAAYLLLGQIYDTCLTMVQMLEVPQILESTVKKCDFDKPLYDDRAHQAYRNSPFEHNSFVFEFASNGVISGNEFKQYLQIQREYKDYVSDRITFFDYPERTRTKYYKIVEKLKTAIEQMKQVTE